MRTSKRQIVSVTGVLLHFGLRKAIIARPIEGQEITALEKHHRNGSITYSHQLLGAALIHPDRREVIPLMPEPIVKQDGTEKNDCERNAAKRFLAKLRQDHPHLR